jgi:arylformamidase
MKIYDVSVAINLKTPVYAGDPNVKMETAQSIKRGDAANVTDLHFGAHTGTHVDAPAHFIEGAGRVVDLPLEVLIGAAQVVEIDETVTAIEAQHVENLGKTNRVLFKTRNSRFWNEPEKGFRKDFTYIAPEAAKILVERGVRLVGIDYLSVEKFGSEDFQTHLTLLQNDVVIIEGLDLRSVAAGEYELVCLPLKIDSEAGDGAPARVVLRQF